MLVNIHVTIVKDILLKDISVMNIFLEVVAGYPGKCPLVEPATYNILL